MKTTYDKAYFIAKFEAIPEQSIGLYRVENQCASYHCGLRRGMPQSEIEALPELAALGALLMPAARRRFSVKEEQQLTSYGAVWRVNDPVSPDENDSPKARILAALHDLP